MEINCNGHASSPESKTSSGEQETKKLEDQQNSNQPEDNTETQDTICNKEEEEICKASHGEPEPEAAVQQLPSSLSSNDAVEPNEGDTESKKMDDMDTQGETKQVNEEEDSQSGLYRINTVFSLLLFRTSRPLFILTLLAVLRTSVHLDFGRQRNFEIILLEMI